MDSIDVVNNLLTNQEAEIEAIKTGALDEGKGRVIVGMRRNQHRTVELALQFRRLQMQSKQKSENLFAGLLGTQKEEPESAKEPEEKQTGAA